MTVYSVASVGAVITLLVLALDPFVQQVVGTAQLVSYIDSDDTERQTVKMQKGSRHWKTVCVEGD